MTEYGALVARMHVRPHPNADRLQLADILGYQIVVGNDMQDGELVLFFSSDLAVSEEYMVANDLVYRGLDGEGNRMGGYFPQSGKVRPQKFRGERSDGYIAPLSSLPHFDEGGAPHAEGDLITVWNNIPICHKYVSAATKERQNRMAAHTPKKLHPDFPKHYDTEQFERYGADIPDGSLVTITAKLHGTSQRTGYVYGTVPVKRTLWDRLTGRRGKTFGEWGRIHGTRNTTCGGTVPGFYGEYEAFRMRAADQLDCTFEGLRENEIWYYEVVGYAGPDRPIMAGYDLSRSQGFKHLGKGDFDYGCLPGQCDVFVYRITQGSYDESHQLQQHDLSWSQVKARCRALGVQHVPEHVQLVKTHYSDVAAHVDSLLKVEVDPQFRHLNEGVIVRVDTPDGRTYSLKAKTLAFKVAEGIIKEDVSSVDLEEVS